MRESIKESSKDRRNKGTIFCRAAKGKRKDGPVEGDKGLYASYHNCGDASSDTSGDTTGQSDVQQTLIPAVIPLESANKREKPHNHTKLVL